MPKGMIRGLFAAVGIGAAASWFTGQHISPLEKTERHKLAEIVARISVVDDQGFPMMNDDVPYIEDIMTKAFLGFQHPDNDYLYKLQDLGIRARVEDGPLAGDNVALHISQDNGAYFSLPKDDDIKDSGIQAAQILNHVYERDDGGESIYGSYTVNGQEVLFQAQSHHEFKRPENNAPAF